MSKGCFNFPFQLLHIVVQEVNMIETYKLFHRYDQEVVPDLGQVQGTTRGHSKKLYIPRSVTEKRKNSFYVRMRRPWNSLSEDLVNAPRWLQF